MRRISPLEAGTASAHGLVLGPALTASFFALFNTYLYRLISSTPHLQLAARSVLEYFASDGVTHLELRTTPRPLHDTSIEDTIRSILVVITAHTSSSTMTTSLILTIDRARHTPSEAMSIVHLAIRLRDEGLPVVGVDLAGDPHQGDIAIFRPAFTHAREANLHITLHFAEIPSVSPAELDEMLSWRPHRLGHVIHVPPALRHQLIESGIGLELCLTCNILAGMLPRRDAEPEIVDHHFGYYHSQAAIVALGTDDVGVFGSGSSQEYFLAAKHFGLSRRDLVDIVRRGIDVTFAPATEKKRIERILRAFENHEDLIRA